MILYKNWMIVTISLIIFVRFSTMDVELQEDPPHKKPPSRSGFIQIWGEEALTHAEWLQLGDRSYKIYQELVTYEGAARRCANHHPDAQLAVVTSFSDSQTLGRYLLTGTPRLSYGWIGARWHGEAYKFEPEPILLQNSSDGTGFPPWKFHKTIKWGKCVLLDRHVANITVFLEANCGRLRPYICYMENSTGFVDLIAGNYGYRLHQSRRNWTDARSYCRDVYGNYSAHLAEIREETEFDDLLQLLRQNGSGVHRVWIGGLFNRSLPLPTWLWDENKDEIVMGFNPPMKWVSDSLYESPNKSDDICMVMDDSEMSYGMACKLEQSYVCQFAAKSLKRLQHDEKKKKEKEAVYSKGHPKHGKQQNNCESQMCTNKGHPDNVDAANGWMQVNQHLYKIFNEPSSYYSANQKCISYHPDVSLASVPSKTHAQILGRHLLKAAWIGDDAYGFEPDTHSSYQRCVALNQHPSDGSLFMESRCQTKRPYICSTENGTGFTDLIIDEHGYRLYHTKRKWSAARDFCKDVHGNHSAHLVEIKNPVDVDYLSALMKKHRRAIRHVWLGGKFYKMGTPSLWFWEDSCEMIPMGSDSCMHWDNNTKYLSSLDDNCIAMDVSGKVNGVSCEYELNYVCQFSAERLRLHQKQEKEAYHEMYF